MIIDSRVKPGNDTFFLSGLIRNFVGNDTVLYMEADVFWKKVKQILTGLDRN